MRKWIVSGLLAALVVAGVALYLKRSERAASAQGITLDRSLVALLPANATSLVGVDVERLKRTAAYRHFEEESRRGDGSGRNHFDEFVAETGFDPRRDVDELLIASWGGGDADAKAQFVAVARGRFQVSSLTRHLREKKATVENYRGFQIFGPEQGRPTRSKEPGGFAFLDDRTALAGSRAGVLGAIDRKVGGGPSLLANTALLGRAQTISGANQVWAVSESPGQVVTHALPKDQNFAQIFSSMQNSTFALDLMNGLELRASGVCKTAQDAKTLGDAARGVVAIGRLSASQKEPELMALFDGIEVDERNAELNISVHMDPQAFEKLLEKTRKNRRLTVGL